jgi:hypothetical protein
MKKYLLFGLAFLLFSFILMSCNKNEEGEQVITVNGQAAAELRMDANGDSKTVTVRGTKAWTAESTDWITVNPKSGAANTNVIVTISVGANNENEERAGTATFTLSTTEFVAVIVTQPNVTTN